MEHNIKMILNNNLITFMKNAVKTAKLVGIDSLIIETGKIRAADQEKTVTIFQTSNIPSLPFNAIGISRVNDFSARLSLVETRANRPSVAISIMNKTGYV